MASVKKTDVELVTLEIDGQSVSVPAGSMIIEASDQIGIDIPRFCYHRKLSIAANCRMCLVDVEKAPKPLPACATPVAEGMKVFTESRRAVDAQRGVMEFLLINHPLDCPICDQGGECELQDLAMGYGRSVSRFTERKRVVKDKNLGSLVATDMTRCIHCTRCVRFLEEVAGTTELGGIGRGEKTEISTFVERNINSELSGNIIDLCPVGALTNKPFRFSARPWEMRAKPSVASHDNVGSNIFYHVRGQKIMRSVPKDNEAVNECWLPDRDRYSHHGLASPERLTSPRIKVDGQWAEASWSEALAVAKEALREVSDPSQLGALISPRATTEEHYLFQKLVRALGSENIDHRLRMSDFSHPASGWPRMDIPTRDWAKSDAIFLVGSNIRHDQPILGHRVRTAWRQSNATIMDLNPAAYEFHFELAHRLIQSPRHMTSVLAAVAQQAGERCGVSVPQWVSAYNTLTLEDDHRQSICAIVDSLHEAHQGVMVLGDVALNHPQSGALRALVEWISATLKVGVCILGGPANAMGACRAGTLPGANGKNASEMLSSPMEAYLLYDFEPAMDTANSGLSVSTLDQAKKVISFSSFISDDLLAVSDVLLPLASVPQTAGSYTNLDGISQSFEASIAPAGDAKEGWKILRRLGEELEITGFDFTDQAAVALELTEAVKAHSMPSAGFEANQDVPWAADTLVRIGDVPIYHCDGLVRRSQPLQDSDHAKAPVARFNPQTAASLELDDNRPVRLAQEGRTIELPWVSDERIPTTAVWLPSAQAEVRGLGLNYGDISFEGHGGSHD